MRLFRKQAEPVASSDPVWLPVDHPLVRAHEANKLRLIDERARRHGAEAELEQLRGTVDHARAEGRKQADAELLLELAGAKIYAALSGVVRDPASIVEDLDLAKFVGQDGLVLTDRVEALRAKHVDLTLVSRPQC